LEGIFDLLGTKIITNLRNAIVNGMKNTRAGGGEGVRGRKEMRIFALLKINTWITTWQFIIASRGRKSRSNHFILPL
jgi:hypothetical protein